MRPLNGFKKNRMAGWLGSFESTGFLFFWSKSYSILTC